MQDDAELRQLPGAGAVGDSWSPARPDDARYLLLCRQPLRRTEQSRAYACLRLRIKDLQYNEEVLEQPPLPQSICLPAGSVLSENPTVCLRLLCGSYTQLTGGMQDARARVRL